MDFCDYLYVEVPSILETYCPDVDVAFIRDPNEYRTNEYQVLEQLNHLDNANPLVYLLYEHLPRKCKSTDAFIMYLMSKPFNYPLKTGYSPKPSEIGGITVLCTPFKGQPWTSGENTRKYFMEKNLLPLELFSVLESAILDAVARNATCVDQTKEMLASHQIPGLIQIFQTYRNAKEPNNKLLYYYFIVKCLTGARSEQLIRVRVSDVFFHKDESNIMLRYEAVKGYKKDKIIFHSFGGNLATGPDKTLFDLPTLFKEIVAFAQELCPNDSNPLVFPFWRSVGISVWKDIQTVNKFLEGEMKTVTKSFDGVFLPHRTRDVTVLLSCISGLDLNEAKKYLCHTEASVTIKNHYSTLKNQFEAYPPQKKKEVFGYLIDNIKIGGINTEARPLLHSQPTNEIRTRGYAIHDEAFLESTITEDWRKIIAISPSIQEDLIVLARTLYPNASVSKFAHAYSLLKKAQMLDWPIITPLILNGASTYSKEDIHRAQKELKGYYDFDHF